MSITAAIVRIPNAALRIPLLCLVHPFNVLECIAGKAWWSLRTGGDFWPIQWDVLNGAFWAAFDGDFVGEPHEKGDHE